MRPGIEHPCAPVHTGSRRLLPTACTVRSFRARAVPHAACVRRGETRCEIWAAQNGIFLPAWISTSQGSCFQGCCQRLRQSQGGAGALCATSLCYLGRDAIPQLLIYPAYPISSPQLLWINCSVSISPHLSTFHLAFPPARPQQTR